jgi:hypothetical protein
MKALRYLTEQELAERAINILIETLGPIETARFLNLPRERQLDSVERHRLWQEKLEQEQFFDQVFGKQSQNLP